MCRNSEVNIILDDFNAEVGNHKDGYSICKYRLGERIYRRNTLVELTKEQEFIAGNVWFQQHPMRLWTWKSADKKQIKTTGRFKVALRFVECSDGGTRYVYFFSTYISLRMNFLAKEQMLLNKVIHRRCCKNLQ